MTSMTKAIVTHTMMAARKRSSIMKRRLVTIAITRPLQGETDVSDSQFFIDNALLIFKRLTSISSTRTGCSLQRFSLQPGEPRWQLWHFCGRVVCHLHTGNTAWKYALLVMACRDSVKRQYQCITKFNMNILNSLLSRRCRIILAQFDSLDAVYKILGLNDLPTAIVKLGDVTHSDHPSFLAQSGEAPPGDCKNTQNKQMQPIFETHGNFAKKN